MPSVPPPFPTSPLRSSLLLLPVPTLQHLLDPTAYIPAIRQASLLTTSHLTIYLLSPLFGEGELALSPSLHWSTIQSFLGRVYGEAVRVAQEKGRVLFEVEVVLQGLGGYGAEETRWVGRAEASGGWEAVWRLEGDDTPLPTSFPALSDKTFTLPYSPISPQTHTPEQTSISSDKALPPTYPVVALGGSFDHIHAGHKILLTMAILVAHRKLIVGVSDDALLVHKACASQLQPLPLRRQLLSAFVRLMNPSLEYDIGPISDVYGPTATDPDIQALVLSQETVAGGDAIAKLRKEKALPPLHTFVISVISHTTEDDLTSSSGERMKEAKMSSTYIRQWLAAHHPQQPPSPLP